MRGRTQTSPFLPAPPPPPEPEPEPRKRGHRPRALTPQQETEALRLKQDGASWSALARRYGVTEATLRRACLRQLPEGAALPALPSGAAAITPRKLTPGQAAEALARHNAGESWAAIARSYGAGPVTVKRAIARLEDDSAGR